MITTMRGCVAHDDLWPWPISSSSFVSALYRLQFWLDYFYIWHKWSLLLDGVSRGRFFFQNLKFGLDLEKKSTVLDGFFSYLAQMITSMRECVAYNDIWPWPISSRSFGRGLENHVRSVASKVLDGFFSYFIQMITSMRRCVACDDLWPWPISSRSFDLDLENRVHSVASTVLDGVFLYLAQMITIIRRCVTCYVFFRIWKFGFFSHLFSTNNN